MRISGHSLHASGPDWSRAIGRNPAILGHDDAIVVLPGQLAHGFDDEDADALGLWLRDAAAKQEASAAAAAAAAPEGAARREAAIAALPGRRSKRGAMRVYYGQGGAAGTRVGQKFKLLSVRQRLARTVRAILAGRDWRYLPRGQAVLALLRSRSD